MPIEVIHPVVQAAADAERRARAIAGVAASIRELLDGAAVSVNRRPLREAMYFWWSAARLRGSLRYRGKYPLAIRWSLEADATRKREEPGLVLDHSVPFLVVANHLIGACDRRDDFIHHLLSDQMVVITKQEDEMITANGHRDSLPESGDPDDRYVGVVPGWTVPAHFR